MTASNQRNSAKRDLVSGSLTTNILRMAVPLAAGSILAAFYNLVDAFWLGRVSKEAVAAPGAVGSFIWMAISLGMGFGTGGTALVAQLVGAKREDEADHVAAQVIMMMAAWTAIVAVPFIVLAPEILHVYRVPSEVLPKAVIYLQIVSVGLPLMGLTISYGAVLRALGDTMTVIIVTACSNIINAALDPLLIFGVGPFPRLGVGGAALATVFAQLLAAIACFLLIRRHHAGLVMKRRHLPPDWPILRQIFGIGLPAALNNSSGSIAFSVFQLMINTMGPTVMAAYTIGFRLLRFFQVPGEVLSLSSAPIVGQALGAERPDIAYAAIRRSALIVALATLVPNLLVTLEGQWVAQFFVKDPGVVVETGRFFLIVPLSSYLFGIIMVLMAAFFGSGHTRPAMMLTIVRMWVLRLPAAYLMGIVLGMGSIGIYWGMVVGNLTAAALSVWMFRRGTWLKPVIAPSEQELAKAVAELAEEEAAQ